MKNFLKKNALRVFITLLGLGGLHFLLREYGYRRIGDDIQNLGFNFIPIAACFLIPFGLQAFAWRLLVSTYRAATFPYLLLVSIVAFAWNNIGPISKSLGEPTRVILLSDRLPVREALRSMMLINLAQSMGTLLTFGLGAALAPLLFHLSETAFWVTVASATMAMALNLLFLFWILRRVKKRRPRTRGRMLRAFRHWVRWITHQLRKYTRMHPWRYASAVLLCAASRMSEGIVFYVIFRALRAPLTLLESVALDTGRGIADNAFFFVPYQLGTREYSLVFITESVLGKSQEAAMAASLVFRLGEITWILIGFAIGLWLMRGKSVGITDLSGLSPAAGAVVGPTGSPAASSEA